jgi:hypothetical protein
MSTENETTDQFDEIQNREMVENQATENSTAASDESGRNGANNTNTQPQWQGKAQNYKPLPRTAPPITDEQFIKERIDDQLNWYNEKSSYNQKKYRFYKRWEFIIGASVPVLVTFIGMSFIPAWFSNFLQIIAALSGIVAVIITKTLELNDYYNYWINYRVTCEALRNEKYKYLSHSEPYDEEDAFPRLVANIDAIMSRETQRWGQKNVKRQQEREEKAKEKGVDVATYEYEDFESRVIAAIQKAEQAKQKVQK